ncbi:hypothetical protein [Nocardia sp. NPDC004711]
MDIQLKAGSPAASDVAADLRALADLAEGDGFIAAVLHGVFERSIFPEHSAAYSIEGGMIVREVPAILAETIRRIKPLATGPVAKTYSDGFHESRIGLRALALRLTARRNDVCERIVTGVTQVTEEVPDPEYLAAAPMVSVTREVEQVEWRCEPILAHAEKSGQ